jgi:hypothetical protein
VTSSRVNFTFTFEKDERDHGCKHADKVLSFLLRSESINLSLHFLSNAIPLYLIYVFNPYPANVENIVNS